ncbi:MAG: ATP-binding cassette domain-containing protein [Wenzhouxiangellaceae bacterium]
MTDPMLEVHALARHFSARGGILPHRRAVLRAVDGVSFEVGRGQTFGLVGESGCGKSTLGRSILRLLEPTRGRVVLDGTEITGLESAMLKRQRKHMQMIFQDPFASLSPRRTVHQTLEEPLALHVPDSPAGRLRRVRELLDIVGLGQAALDRYPHEFSGGQRQRIGIARALAVEPKLVVADEPVSALDVSVQSQVLNLLADLQREFGLSFVFISHDLAVVQHVSHFIGVMYLGKLVETAPVDRIYAMPAHPYTRALLDAVPVAGAARRDRHRVLEGELPSPLNPPAGCPFHTRCPEAMPICAQRVPRTIELGEHRRSHQVRCHLHDPDISQ